MISCLLQGYIYLISYIKKSKMRKLLEAQFMLQGTEIDIDKIEKEIAEISMHKGVVAFNLNEKKEK